MPSAGSYTKSSVRYADKGDKVNGGSSGQRSTRDVTEKMEEKRADAVDCTHHWENLLEDGARRYKEFKHGRRDVLKLESEDEREQEVEEMQVDSGESESEDDGELGGEVKNYGKATRGQKREHEGKDPGPNKKQKDNELEGERRMVRELF